MKGKEGVLYQVEVYPLYLMSYSDVYKNLPEDNMGFIPGMLIDKS